MKRILYVEDHTESCELLDLWLRGAGYEIVPATTISEGLSMANSGYFDAYLISGWFADGTGAELCGAIRLFDSITPIIFYSALTRDRDQEAAINAGAQAYLIKPDDLERIEPTIRSLISAGKVSRTTT